MTPLAAAFVALSAIALLALPRRWAPVPLLMATCYMTLGQGIEIRAFSFTALRLLVAVGVIRVAARGERLTGKMHGLDWVVVVWSAWAAASSAFHEEEGSLVFRLGLVYNAAGLYFLLRVFCCSTEDVVRLCRATAVILVPVAAEMVYEHVAFHNLFSYFGGVPEVPQLREGKVRAFGPFTHPILAGTVGAVTLPLMAGLWSEHRRTALIGVTACITMVLASASSGPFMSALASIVALGMWQWRTSMRLLRWGAFFAYVALDLVMNAPAYYLIAYVDVVGGSTGFHRARLIESALEHFAEWWLTGTDYTRHWMVTGVTWSPNHADITNHYLYMGVLGGLPLLLLFLLKLVKGFSFVGSAWRRESQLIGGRPFFIWGLGSSVFAHAATSVSVSYFDQSFAFLYLSLAAVGSVMMLPTRSAATDAAASRRAADGHTRDAESALSSAGIQWHQR